MNRLDEIRQRLEEDNPYRPQLRGKVGCRRADDWNLQQTRDLRDLLAVAEAARRYCDRWIDTTFAPDDIETAALLDALARLDTAEVSA